MEALEAHDRQPGVVSPIKGPGLAAASSRLASAEACPHPKPYPYSYNSPNHAPRPNPILVVTLKQEAHMPACSEPQLSCIHVYIGPACSEPQLSPGRYSIHALSPSSALDDTLSML